MDAKSFSKETSKLIPILKALSDEDSLRILVEAEKGLPSSLEAPKLLGMTKRRYYMRLKELLDLGLIKRGEDSYKPTIIGKVAIRIIFDEFLKLLPHANILDNIYELGLSDHDKIQNLIPELSREDVFSLKNILDRHSITKFIISFEELVAIICEELDNSNSEILFASKYLDLSVTKKIFELPIEKIKLYGLLEFDLSDFFNFIKYSLKYFKMSIEVLKLFSSENLSIRRSNLPLSFLIIDNKRCIFELPPIDKNFYMAIMTDDKLIIEKMSNIFWKLWQKSSPMSINPKHFFRHDITSEYKQEI